MSIDERIEQLDLSLFGHISAQTTGDDQRSLMAVQTVIRRNFPGFIYLEIGSHSGSSLQTFVVDPKCARIISIDPRSGATPDCRGTINYKPGSVESMLELLKQIPGGDVSKIKTFETTSASLTRERIGVRPQLCFIDGQHTDEAVVCDARFCLSALAENGIILFHVANIIYGGLQAFLAELKANGRVFRAAVVPGSIFLIEFGSLGLCEMEPLRGQVRESFKAYLYGMQENDLYREAYPLSIARVAKMAHDIYKASLYRALRKVKRLFFKPKLSKT